MSNIGKRYIHKTKILKEQEKDLKLRKRTNFLEFINDTEVFCNYLIFNSYHRPDYFLMILLYLSENLGDIPYVFKNSEYGTYFSNDINIEKILKQYLIDPEFNSDIIQKYIESHKFVLATNISIKDFKNNHPEIPLLKEEMQYDNFEFNFICYNTLINDKDFRRAVIKVFKNYKQKMIDCYLKTLFPHVLGENFKVFSETEQELIKKIFGKDYLQVSDIIKAEGHKKTYNFFLKMFKQKQEDK